MGGDDEKVAKCVAGKSVVGSMDVGFEVGEDTVEFKLADEATSGGLEA